MNCWIILLLLFGCGNRKCGYSCGDICDNDYRNESCDCMNERSGSCVNRVNDCVNRGNDCANRGNDCANARPATWNDCDCNNDYSGNNSSGYNSSRQDFPGFNRCDTCGCENN